jgi:D-tyrosyl-tRNA(Tyr) deacylase
MQRVRRASVRVEGTIVGEIGAGLLLFLGVERGDGESDLDWYVNKAVELRIFADDEGRMNRSLIDVGGAALVVSQFTLAATISSGRRPSYSRAAAPEIAEPLYELFIKRVIDRGIPVQSGRFGAMMDVELINDGPVTLWLERAE